jgi:hypothetical protein
MPNSHEANRERQQEETAREDSQKAKKQRCLERCEVHSLVWVQREEGLPLPPTPKNTSSNRCGEGWFPS